MVTDVFQFCTIVQCMSCIAQRTCTILHSMQVKAQAWRAQAEAHLLQHLAHVPGSLGPHGSSFRMLRSAGAAATAGRLDLMRAACGPASQLRSFNPFLSDISCTSLQDGIRTWLQLCVLEDRLGRLAALAAAGPDCTVLLIQVGTWKGNLQAQPHDRPC